MFEPQDHPDDIPYPGAPPTPPYDSAGWTLAFQMGVKFDRILDAFDGPFEAITTTANPPAGRVVTAPGAAGYVVSHHQNDAFIAVNRLLKTEQTSIRFATRSTSAPASGPYPCCRRHPRISG